MAFRAFFVLFFMVFVAGCVTVQEPVAAKQEIWQEPQEVIGVVLIAPKKFEFHIEGQIGLLDVAIINAATSALQTHIESLSTDDVFVLDDDAQKYLNENGLKVVLHKPVMDIKKMKDFSPPQKQGYSRVDFRELKEKNGYGKLLLITINDYKFGISRGYYGFMPLTDPYVSMMGVAQMIDLEDNSLLWHYAFNISKFSEGPWDEPPNFPGLTNAIYQAVEELRLSLRKQLVKP